MIRFFSHIFNTFDKLLFTGISMVICKIGWSIRSWLSDYISFSFYKSCCRHDIYWILVAFMIAASALIKVSRLYGLYRHLYTQLIYWHCAVILYTHVNVFNKRFWILNPESCHIFPPINKFRLSYFISDRHIRCIAVAFWWLSNYISNYIIT